jgi:hypothetical protein
MNNDGSPFCFLPVAPVVLFGKNAPPPSKSIMQIQPSTAKLTPKRKRSSEAVAPRARAKTRKVLVRKVRKEAAPSPPNPEVPVTNQVRITFPFLYDQPFVHGHSSLISLFPPAACRCGCLQWGRSPAPAGLGFGGTGGCGRAH